MQTIYLDISNKSVLPVIYAKQGDVGRKFRVLFSDAGVKYNIPENGVFSVWYDGESGEGNYTSISDKSAITINGNEVIVEIITQMVSNPGDGILCLVLFADDGNQIGSWNIEYCVESVPGLDSVPAEQYYTALSEVATEAAKSAVIAKQAVKYVDSKFKGKAGLIYPLATNAVPEGFLLCDGAEYSRTDYAELFDAIGTVYGEGDGKSTFNVPNLSTRVPVGAGDNYELGAVGGKEKHTLNVDEIPEHKHVLTSLLRGDSGSEHTTTQYTAILTGDNLVAPNQTLNAHVGVFSGGSLETGGGQPHNIMQPYTVVNYIISTGKEMEFVVGGPVSGGASVELDATLTQEGMAADAKAVGDAIGYVENNIIEAMAVGDSFVVLDKTYPGVNGDQIGYLDSKGVTANARYRTYSFVATKDFECYVKPEDYEGHAVYILGVYDIAPTTAGDANRLRDPMSKDIGNLPTEDNKLSVREGEYVAITVDRMVEENFHLYQNMTSEVVIKKYLKEDICLADTQIDQVMNKFAPVVSKQGGVLSIWLPLKRKNGYYAHFTFELASDTTINQNIWKFDEFGIVDNSFNDIFTPSTGLEWTAVFRETDTLDFVGGYHGDELMDMMSIFLDGKEITMDGDDFGKKNFTELRFVIKSTVNRCDTPDVNLFTRYQDIVVSADGIQHNNRWIALAEVSLATAYLGMMGFNYIESETERVKYCRYNDGYIVQPVDDDDVPGSCVNFSGYANQVELWGNNFLARLTVINTNFSDYKGNNEPTACRVVRSYAGNTKSAKAYYQANGILNLTKGNELRGQWKHEFI